MPHLNQFGFRRRIMAKANSYLNLFELMGFNSFVTFHCPLIWLFCSKVANNEINRTHKRALRTLYRDYESMFEELLDRGEEKAIHR